MESLPRLDVVVVYWNSGPCVARCLDALATSTYAGFTLDRVVVVDNASEPPYAPPADAGVPAVTVLRNESNRGFAEACLRGAAGSRAEYLLFLNPDTRVPPDALAHAVATLERPEHARTGILGLPLVDANGTTQATCGRFLTVSRIFNQVTGLSLLAPDRFQGFRMTDWHHGDTRFVDYVSGACLLVRRSLFQELDGFDRRFVVYLEDVDLALRAKARGWNTLYLAGPSVYHEGGWGTGRDRGLRLSYAWRSLLAYGHKHFGVMAAVAVAVLVLGAAPLARAAQAVAHRSVQELLDAVAGCGRLWLTLAREAIAGLGPASRPAAGAAPGASMSSPASPTAENPIPHRQTRTLDVLTAQDPCE